MPPLHQLFCRYTKLTSIPLGMLKCMYVNRVCFLKECDWLFSVCVQGLKKQLTALPPLTLVALIVMLVILVLEGWVNAPSVLMECIHQVGQMCVPTVTLMPVLLMVLKIVFGILCVSPSTPLDGIRILWPKYCKPHLNAPVYYALLVRQTACRPSVGRQQKKQLLPRPTGLPPQQQ